MCSIGTKNSQILFWLASFVLTSLYKDVENIVNDVQGSNSKANETSGLSFGLYKEVPHVDTHTHKTSHARKLRKMNLVFFYEKYIKETVWAVCVQNDVI